MSEVNRDPIRWERSMTQDKDGQYVSYHDYTVLLNRYDSLRADLAAANEQLEKMRDATAVAAVPDGEPLCWICPPAFAGDRISGVITVMPERTDTHTLAVFASAPKREAVPDGICPACGTDIKLTHAVLMKQAAAQEGK